MARRRLTAIAGALGLVAWLVSSGVTAQADTSPGPDSTYLSLLATYSWSNQNVCYANSGTADHSIAGTCTITQTTPTGKRDIAVCVQSSSAPGATQECDITQTNDTYNNYALVIQRVNQQDQSLGDAGQRASISQTNTSGSNFAAIIQNINQSLNVEENDPSQYSSQAVQSVSSLTPGLAQVSGTGSNFAAVGQLSVQTMGGGAPQMQTSVQFAGFSGFGVGINQTTGGRNAAALSQVQKQQLDSGNATTQSQVAQGDGDITQNGKQGTNLASGNQFQDQRERGPLGVTQDQTGDPKCCSSQNGGQFFINQTTNQLANHIAPLHQRENIEGNCDSVPNGCHVRESATQNGVTTPNSCTGSSCHPTIVCAFGEGAVAGCVATPGTPPPTPTPTPTPTIGMARANGALIAAAPASSGIATARVTAKAPVLA